jgi:peroxiredoxin
MTLEKILKYSIAAVALFIVGYLAYQQLKPEPTLPGKLEKLPKFSFLQIGSKGEISRSDLRGGKTVVLYFSPDCEHCRALGEDIGRQLGRLRDIDFVFVTRFDEGDAIAYARDFGLWEQPNMYFGLDMNASFYNYFGEMYVPSTYVFNEDGKLLQVLYQNTMVSDILDVLAGKVSDKNKGTR